MQNMQLSEDFNENDSKYKCFCGFFDVVTGVKVFLVLYIFGNIIGSIFLIFTSGWAVVGFMFGVLVIVASCTIYALINEKHAYLWAFIIVMMITIVLSFLYLLLSSYLFFFNKEWTQQVIKNYYGKEGIYVPDHQIVEMVKICQIYVGVILVQLVYDGWVLWVLFGCKRYFEDKSKAKIMNITYAAPHSKALLPTYGKVEPPPYEL